MDFITLALACAPQVAPATMAAIVQTESNFRPLAININTKGVRLERQPANHGEAVATAKWLLGQGYNIDVGLAQVNSTNWKRYGLTPETAFDPCLNLSAGAQILHGNYQSASKKTNDEQTALRAALSAYNTGSFTRGFGNGYVGKVVANAGVAEANPARPIPLEGAKAPNKGKAAPPAGGNHKRRAHAPTALAQSEGAAADSGHDFNSVMGFR